MACWTAHLNREYFGSDEHHVPMFPDTKNLLPNTWIFLTESSLTIAMKIILFSCKP